MYGGTFFIEKINGDLDINMWAGSISGNTAAKAVKASLGVGDIKFSFKEVTHTNKISLSCKLGDIEVLFPPGILLCIKNYQRLGVGMQKTMLNAKIHRATVTQAYVDYIGSITIDKTLMDAASILPYELVHVVDVTNGSRIQTYAIEGEADSGIIGINGAAAHLIKPHDIVIIMSYVTVESSQILSEWQPKVIFVDPFNKMIDKVYAL